MIQKDKLQLVVANIYALADSLQALVDGIHEESTPSEVKEISLEDVRGKLAELSQAGKTAEVRELIKKYGGTRLSDVEPDKFANLLKDAEGMSNAG